MAREQEHKLAGRERQTLSLRFRCSICSENCKVKLFGIVTIPSGNINYIEQNLFSLLKSQHKTVVN